MPISRGLNGEAKIKEIFDRQGIRINLHIFWRLIINLRNTTSVVTPHVLSSHATAFIVSLWFPHTRNQVERPSLTSCSGSRRLLLGRLLLQLQYYLHTY